MGLAKDSNAQMVVLDVNAKWTLIKVEFVMYNAALFNEDSLKEGWHCIHGLYYNGGISFYKV